MKLFNTLSNQVEVFKPITPGHVNMYVCGPTVYNDAHIGNARPIVVFDTLRRLFEALGYQVKYVSNFTDVDDKIIQKAKEEGVDELTLTKKYIAAYNEVRAQLHTLTLTKTPKVTETMQEIITFIKALEDKGYAYQVDGDVYFRISALNNYGQLSKQKVEDLIAGARVEENDKKENPLDFTLWKATEMGIRWQAPWSLGRPGWHTECVVMIDKEFNGQKIDIHGGGSDLKFPHHENEIAQAEAMYHSTIANYWLHNGMLNFDGEKMSKSLGNVQLAKDVIAQLGSNVTRWLLLSAYYRDALKYNDDVIKQAQGDILKIETIKKQVAVKRQLEDITLSAGEQHQLYQEFLDAMCDDLNTPNAYTVINQMVKQLNQEIRQKSIDWQEVLTLDQALTKALSILGIFIEVPSLSVEDKSLYHQWQQAKQQKDFQLADQLRQTLVERGLL